MALPPMVVVLSESLPPSISERRSSEYAGEKVPAKEDDEFAGAAADGWTFSWSASPVGGSFGTKYPSSRLLPRRDGMKRSLKSNAPARFWSDEREAVEAPSAIAPKSDAPVAVEEAEEAEEEREEAGEVIDSAGLNGKTASRMPVSASR